MGMAGVVQKLDSHGDAAVIDIAARATVAGVDTVVAAAVDVGGVVFGFWCCLAARLLWWCCLSRCRWMLEEQAFFRIRNCFTLWDFGMGKVV